MDVQLKSLLLEDKEIKFDTAHLLDTIRNGEEILEKIELIEDTKGNSGDTGRLIATNLRLIWCSLVHKKFNLSIGYGQIVSLYTRMLYSKIRGNNVVALYVLAFSGNAQFEFHFSDISGDSKRKELDIFQTVLNIYQLYQRTYLYRDLKLRGAIIQSGQLVIMPQEQVYNNVNGVWNLSSDQGNLGSFVITNIRLVWFAADNETFNISLPYLQIASIKIRDSKYGPALVVQTSETSGNYMLGFRIDPPERLVEIHKELVSLYTINVDNPNFGIHISMINQRKSQELINKDCTGIEDFCEIDEKQEKEVNSKLNAYLIGVGNDSITPGSRNPVYCKELGFAIQRIRSGYHLRDLWDVIPMKIDDNH